MNLLKKKWLAVAVLTSLLVPAALAQNAFTNSCPRTATESLVTNYDQNAAALRAKGRIIELQNATAANTTAGRPATWAYLKVTIKDNPAMAPDAVGTLDFKHPFKVSNLLYYKGKNKVQSDWFFHAHNDVSQEVIRPRVAMINAGFSDSKRINMAELVDIQADISLKDFALVEYSGYLPNKGDYCFTHTLFMSSSLLANPEELKIIVPFFNGMTAKFTDYYPFEGRTFITAIKSKQANFIGTFMIKRGKLIGELKQVTALNQKAVMDWINAGLARNPVNNAVYLYGDNLFNLGNALAESAYKNNVTLIARNTAIQKSFNETETVLEQLRGKKIDPASLSFINGTPANETEVAYQSFEKEQAPDFASLKKLIDEKTAGKTAKVINTPEDLVKELASGDNDVLWIIAHCDNEYLYFGSGKISLKELGSLPARTGRTKPRTAIIASCLAGKVFDQQRPWLGFFKKNLQSVSEILLEKKFFDFIISPPGELNGNEVLDMIDKLSDYDIIELSNYFNQGMKKIQPKKTGNPGIVHIIANNSNKHEKPIY